MARICTDLFNKMEEQVLEKLRAEALSHCRQLFEAESSNNDLLPTRSVLTLITSPTLAQHFFVLCDHDNRGSIEPTFAIQLIKYNLRSVHFQLVFQSFPTLVVASL